MCLWVEHRRVAVAFDEGRATGPLLSEPGHLGQHLPQGIDVQIGERCLPEHALHPGEFVIEGEFYRRRQNAHATPVDTTNPDQDSQ
ncbi:hypothetical protein JF737_19875 [Mycobacterium avium]|uniref:hypothetical protein n=1 Tax=Mycobacterium avium TaxID=1764 RepID=UPI001D314027|nr:hypothetical protein [Mycobacterium sp. DSM 3803]MCA2239954.1 hypothetical protein [Mycobacterium avium]MCA4710823.1 hypothetical protein [Mycobacterium avium subsp. hominissuis]MCA2258661.1 hypothetical protein [Mycobacterium avium]MCA2270371.1 hypothetical protein [Mycobacterium avium]